MPVRPEMLRPGGTIMGPALMTLADTAMYFALLVAIGPVLDLVTTSLDIHFLRRPIATDVEDTHVRVLRGLPTFDPRGAARLSTWILTIATRVVLNDGRRAVPTTLGHDPAAPAAGAEAGLARARLGAAIGAAVAALPTDQRAVLVLREYFELDLAAIADALDVEVGTIKSRLSRARAALREQLTRQGVTL